MIGITKNSVLACLLLLFTATVMPGCKDEKAPVQEPLPKEVSEVPDTTSVANEDSVPNVDFAAPGEEATMETSAEEASLGEAKLHPVYMGMWGYVGGTGFNLDMDGTTGSYMPFDWDAGEEYGARRQLKLVSYSPQDGICVINAYLKGAYIGQFKGVFQESEEDDPHFVQFYDGIFTSVKGARLDFHFHFD